ncbi:MAG: MazG-like family protein [Candidatus Saccharimonadales bacterium]
MSDIQELQKVIRKFCDDRNWDQFHNLKDLLISLNLESSEALEHVQWKNEKELEELIKNNKALGEELADVLYWTLLIANKADIDLSAAFTDKMKCNDKKYPIEKTSGSHKKYTELA